MNEIQRQQDAGLPSDLAAQRALRRDWENGLLPNITPTLLSGLLTVDMHVDVSTPAQQPVALPLQVAQPIMGRSVELAFA